MKRGFTLIELLAVIVILAIIALIAVPIVINIIEDAKKSSQEESLRQYGKAVENGVANYLLNHPNDKDITLDKIESYIKYSGDPIECKTVQINEKGKIYLANCSINNTKVEYTYGEKQRDPNITVDLPQGLTPVIYDEANEKWIVVDKNDTKWYDYDEQKWANAVVLGTDVTKQVGDEVKVDGSEAKMMLVYIPRYEYKIEGQYGKHLDGTEGTQSLPGEIEVNFIGKNITTPTEGYHIHPAFTFDGEKGGFWVGKFEISSVGTNLTSSNNLGCSTTSCTNAQYLRILPNKPSLRYNNVSNFWYGIKSIEKTSSFGLSNIDIHMMKNSEWGAVAYLSQSKYGKYGNNDYEGAQKEVYQNKDTGYVTGKSNGTPSQSTSYTQCSYNQKKGTDTNQDQNNCGPGASTTGNIYGVYDMSGGAYEYVMGAYGTSTPTIKSSGFGSTVFTGNMIESKYYDIYKTNNVSTACDNNGPCLGHAMSETASWYGDYASMVSSSSPWFVRGGNSNYTTTAGVFYRSYDDGNSYNSYSARVVGFVK